MQLQVLLLFLTPAVLSTLAPDRYTRAIASSSRLKPRADITVRPIDPNNAEAVEIYEMDLIALYRDQVKREGEGADLVWKITVPDEEVEMLKQYEGLTVEGENERLARVKRQTPPLETENMVTYIAAPNNDNSDEDNAEVRTFLDGKVTNMELIQEITLDGKLQLWGGLNLSPEAKIEVEADPRIAKPLREDVAANEFRALQEDRRRSVMREIYDGVKSQVTDMKRSIVKRTTTWRKQLPAQIDMVQNSRFEGAPFGIKGFVYDSRAGDGIFIYVIDSGVERNIDNKDPTPGADTVELSVVPKEEILQSTGSRMLGEDPDSDSSEPDENAQPPRIGSHGTMVAVKAAGKRYGIAKKATIVPVKIVPGVYEIILGMNMAFQDIKSRERGRNSVIVMSLGIGKESEKTDRDKCLDDPVLKKIMPIIQGLHELGVPIVFAAGNARTDKDGQVDRDIIDSFPQVMENGDAVPIINVGAYDSGPGNSHGDRMSFSQGGDQLTVYAPGKNIFAPKKDSVRGIFTGTSVAAPVVGGIIATILSMDEADQPDEIRGKEGLERVKGIRDLVRGEKYSWEHKEGQTPKVNCIWTSAGQNDHDGAEVACAGNSKIKRQDGGSCSQAPLPAPTPEPPTPEPPTPEPPTPEPPTPEGHCRVSQQGFGGGQYEISGKNWPSRDTLEDNLKSKMGSDGFEYKISGNDNEEFVAHTSSGANPDEMLSKLRGIIKDLAGIDVTCDA